MSETNQREQASPTRGRWQFSLRQMFAAVTGIALVLGWAKWQGQIESATTIYLSIAVLAGVFSRAARQALVGSCFVISVIWITGVLDEITIVRMGVILSQGIDPSTLLWSTLLVLCAATSLRANFRIGIWTLAGSFVLIELFVTAAIFDSVLRSFHLSTLNEVLGFGNDRRTEIVARLFRGSMKYHFLKQRWYIAAPWLLGIVVGEVIVRRRSASESVRQEV
jgi:hypothetical protein